MQVRHFCGLYDCLLYYDEVSHNFEPAKKTVKLLFKENYFLVESFISIR